MNVDDVRRKLEAEFAPCRVFSSSGHEYVVTHPDCVLVGPYSVALLDRDGFMVTLGHDHIVAIKDEPLKKNGLKKR